MTHGVYVKAMAVAASVLAAWPVTMQAREADPGRVAAVGSYLAGRYAQTVEDWDAAAGFMAEALAQDPANPALRRQMFTVALADGDYDRALTLAEEVVGGERADAAFAGLLLVAADIRNGNFSGARARLTALPEEGFLRLVKPLLAAWIGVGAGGTCAEAVAALETSPLIARTESWFALHAAMLCESAGDAAEAARRYDRVGTLPDVGSLRIIDALGGYLARGGTIKVAGPKSGDAPPAVAADAQPRRLSVADGAAQSLFDVASALVQQESFEYALPMGRLALFVRPVFPLARLLLGDVAAERGRHAEALALYRDLGGPVDPRLARAAWLRSVDSLQELKRTEEALVEIRRFLAAAPEDVDGLVRLGDLQRIAGDHTAAVAAYGRALDRLPADNGRRWNILYGRALAHDRRGDWPAAEADFLAALSLSPQEAILLNYLGYSWADRGIHLERARTMIEAAVAARPNDGFIVDSLGWVLFRQGDVEGAIRHLERAIVLQPLDPTINDHLGDVYWHAERRLEAAFQWHRALKYAGAEDAALKVAVEQKLKERLGNSRSAEAVRLP